MSIIEFKNIVNLLGGGSLSEEEQQNLFKEALLMTLARATSADTNIAPVEISSVQEAIKAETGEDIDEARIRVAAASEIFETTPLQKYLSKTAQKIPERQRMRIVNALKSIIKSDVRVSPFEIEFFNMVANALHVSPAVMLGLDDGDH
ncbi:MAG: hypothetical protein HKN70_03920 [Gammaproteobacteria bacterium]|nr:hypothetical protein [Gammaproteobacteria bacterium]